MGRRDSRAHLLRDEALLGAPLLRCNRGGELTYHGPGQLVGYFHARLTEMGGKKTEVGQKKWIWSQGSGFWPRRSGNFAASRTLRFAAVAGFVPSWGMAGGK